MYNLSDFGLRETTLLGAELRRLASSVASVEELAQAACGLLYRQLDDGTSGGPASVLVRCYKTHAFGDLPPELQQAARQRIPDTPIQGETRCLTLLGSYGDREEWRHRNFSRGHRAIPLASEEIVRGLPIVVELLRSLGLEPLEAVRPTERLLQESERNGFNVFHVAEAEVSPFVPAQAEFVRPLGVRSVVGFGFALPPAEIISVVLFTRIPVDAATADLFRTVALSLKLAFMQATAMPVFAGAPAPMIAPERELLRIRAETLQQLVAIHERQARDQFQLIARQRADLELRADEVTASNEALRDANTVMRNVLAAIPGALLVTDAAGRICTCNGAARALLGREAEQLEGLPIEQLFDGSTLSLEELSALRGAGSILRLEKNMLTGAGQRIPVLLSVAELIADTPAGSAGMVFVAVDLRDRRELEMELRQAQKLESVGRLAAGFAHEVNTPIQFVSDSMQFVSDSLADLLPLIERLRALRRSLSEGQKVTPRALADIEDAEQASDVDYVVENVPRAIQRSLDGLGRVAHLVRSLKEFAHPDQRSRAAADLNGAIASAVLMARHEYERVAELETDFGELPMVTCQISDLNQVFLNIIVNAAHAIADAGGGPERKGRIRIVTRTDGETVLVTVSDTGCGVPECARGRIFDPFFTTKEVGRGAGQGLAIAHNVVAEKHGGSLTFESTPGQGTTFFVRLPLHEKRISRRVA